MEAKETVLTMKQLSELNSAMPSTAKYGEVFEFIAEKQAEISFKAGRQEVVEWVKANADLERGDRDVGLCFEDYLFFDYKDWQGKLKDWGIKPQ